MVGSYGPNFFGYSVTHDISDSRRVFGKLAGNLYERRPDWESSSEHDKHLMLVEAHESAHHHLFSSTPCGLLLWRLNQVIFRDIEWAKTEAESYGVSPPKNSVPCEFYQQSDFFERLIEGGCQVTKAEYLRDVYKNIDNCLIVRDILFGARAPDKKDYESLTLSDLAARLNSAFDWMSKRCAIPWTRKWKVKGDPMGLVFAGDSPINAHDISEAHAVAHELSLIRAYGDIDGFHQRYMNVIGTNYERGVEVGKRGLPIVSDIDFSPSHLRHRGLLAFSTCIDLTVALAGKDDLYIDEHLPWFNYEHSEIFSSEYNQSAIQVLSQLVTSPIYLPDSQWGQTHNMNVDPDLQKNASNMLWLGMDLQVRAFHRNAEVNIEYLYSFLNKKDFAYDQVAHHAVENNYLIEYGDELYALIVNLEEIYKENWSLLSELGFEHFNSLGMQMLCHLFNGAKLRNSIARFLGEQVPSPSIILPKLSRSIRRQYLERGFDKFKVSELVDTSATFLTKLIENGEFGENDDANFLVNDYGRFIC